MKVKNITIDKFFSIRNADTDTPEMDLFGYIGVNDEVNYAGVKNGIRQLKAMGATQCKLNINSGGGDVIEGLAIHDEMKASGIKFTPHVIGIAGSMGAVLAFSGESLPYMTPNARLMLHKPQAGTYGESTSLRDTADLMDTLEGNLKGIIKDRTGKTDEDLEPWFQPGRMKWFSTPEAVDAGLAREAASDIVPMQRPIPVENFTEAMTAREAYDKIYNIVTNSFTNTPSEMKLDITNLSKLSLKADAGDTEINNAVAAVIQRAETAESELKTLKDKQAAEVKNRGKMLIDNAIKEKKLTEGERAQWEADYEAAPEVTERVLNKLQAPVNINNNINRGGGEGDGKDANDRSKWTVYDWQEKDLDGLLKMKVENNAQYVKLYNDQNIDITAD